MFQIGVWINSYFIARFFNVDETFMVWIKNISLFVMLLGPSSLWAQEYLSGRLIDDTTNQPVIYANILVKGKSKGVISNEDGGFRIPTTYAEQNNQLVISSLGYETLHISAEEFRTDDIQVIRMTPKITKLPETTVIAYTNTSLAKKIVRRAIRKIPDNYPRRPFVLVGYYRDYQRQQQNYINLNEAIVEIQDAGFGKKDQKTTNFRIFDFQENFDFPRDTLSSLSYDYRYGRKTIDNAYIQSYGGNEMLILRVHDAIRNYDYGAYSFVGKLKHNFLPNHTFTMDTDVYLDGQWLYSINFETRKENTLAKGNLLVSKDNYSIYRLNYAVYSEGLWITSQTGRASEKGALIFEVRSEYRLKDGKMYLNYLSFSNDFTVRIPPVFKVIDIEVNIATKEISVLFSSPPDDSSTQNTSHFHLNFLNNKVPIEVLPEEEPDRIKLKPVFNKVSEENQFYEEILEASRKNDSIPFQLNINGLKDMFGNEINAYHTEKYLQFREFFTQKTFPMSDPLQKTGPYMDKTKPLDKKQSVFKNGGQVNEYWMNTPLKN